MKTLVKILLPLLLLASCRVNSTLLIHDNGSGEMENSIVLSPFFEEFFFDIFEKDPLMEEIQLSLRNHPGLINPLMEADNGRFTNRFGFMDINRLPGISDGMMQLKEQGNEHRLEIRMNRENWNQLETLVPMLADPSISYLGPEGSLGLTRPEFRDMLIYPFEGYAPTIEDAEASLDDSRIVLRIKVDGTISAIQNGIKVSSSEAEFTLPLFDLLMLDRELFYSLTYR